MPTEESVRKDMEADREAKRISNITDPDTINAWDNGFHQGWYSGVTRMINLVNNALGKGDPNV